MKKLLFTVAVAMCLCPIFADSVTDSNQSDWYLSPIGSFIQSDMSRGNDKDNGYDARFMIGKQVTDRFDIEMGPELNRFHRSENTDLEQMGFKVNSLYFFNREGAVSPYFSTGLGIFKTSETGDTNPQYSVGLGMMSKVAFMKDAKLRTEITFNQEIDSSQWSHDDFKASIGVRIPFGASAPALIKPVLQDSDGDGVIDANDNCPSTPRGAVVDEFGCELDSDKDGVVNSQDACPNTPIGIKVNSRGCELDSDNDGVKDSLDECPGTPAGRKVDARGCALPLDSDNDGVADSNDHCPNTPMNTRVDFKGCEINAVITLPEVHFEFDSSKLKTSSYRTLDGAVATMQKYTDIRAIVAGHTDSIGNDAYNHNLSDRRAASVRSYMISKGIAAERLIAKGYGETRPISDNSTKEGRRINRRVNLEVQK